MKNSVTKGMGEITIRKGTVWRGAGSTTYRLGIGMLDTSSKGIRCRAARDIPSLEGMIKSLAMGTIVFELVGSRFDKARKDLAEPSRPGHRKSKIDQRSLSRFSTGVPVKAKRARLRRDFTARA